jgi:putative transposase
MWVASSEGAKFWQQVLTELKNRGVRDIFIGCVDGLKGFPEAMEVVFPATQVQYLQKILRWELGRTKYRCSGA